MRSWPRPESGGGGLPQAVHQEIERCDGRLPDDLGDRLGLQKLRLELVVEMVFVEVLLCGDIDFIKEIGSR